MTVSRHPWGHAPSLQKRLRALAAAQAELRVLMAELDVCPYRAGVLGAAAPVLPSPDELRYAANILDRATSCVRHALVTARHDEMAE